MTDYIQVWQCIGCGRIEAPQTCIGVCRDRKVFMIGKGDHEREIGDLKARMAGARERLLRFGHSTPRDGYWQQAYVALQEQVYEVLALLAEPIEPVKR